MIYFIRAGEDGPVKIGHTKNVKSRLVLLQTAHHVKLRVIRSLDAPASAEGWLHQHFAKTRLSGEWFRFDETMLTIDPPREEMLIPLEVDIPNVPLDNEKSYAAYSYPIRLPHDLYLAIRDFAKKDHRSPSNMVIYVLKRWLATQMTIRANGEGHLAQGHSLDAPSPIP